MWFVLHSSDLSKDSRVIHEHSIRRVLLSSTPTPVKMSLAIYELTLRISLPAFSWVLIVEVTVRLVGRPSVSCSSFSLEDLLTPKPEEISNQNCKRWRVKWSRQNRFWGDPLHSSGCYCPPALSVFYLPYVTDGEAHRGLRVNITGPPSLDMSPAVLSS